MEREEEVLGAPSGSGAVHPEAACGEMAEAVSEGHGDSNAAPEDVREGLGDVWGGGKPRVFGGRPGDVFASGRGVGGLPPARAAP